MKIRKATKVDLNRIEELWLDCFDDSEEYIRFYLEHCFSKVKIYLLIEFDTPIGMIHLLPCSLMGQNAYYWYAVGISTDCRGKGYFRSFASEVLKLTRKEGYANLCKPADGLYELYRSLGFQNPFLCQYTHFDKKTCIESNIEISEATSEDYLDLQKKEGSVSWDRDFIAYALKENIYCGGKNVKFVLNQQCYLATAIKDKDQYVLTNTNITDEVFKLAGNKIFSYLNCEKIDLRDYSGKDTEYALSDKPIDGEGISLFFTLE